MSAGNPANKILFMILALTFAFVILPIVIVIWQPWMPSAGPLIEERAQNFAQALMEDRNMEAWSHLSPHLQQRLPIEDLEALREQHGLLDTLRGFDELEVLDPGSTSRVEGLAIVDGEELPISLEFQRVHQDWYISQLRFVGMRIFPGPRESLDDVVEEWVEASEAGR